MAAPTQDHTGQTRLAPLPPTPKVDIPEARSFRFKSKFLGKAMHTDQLQHERLGKPTALAVFASDNLSSAAYATEEILHTLLVVGGVGLIAFDYVLPITIAMIVVLVILIISYRQTIKAYPSAGGAYIVTKDNLGVLPAQVAGVSLLTDYILVVAVSCSAGVAALYSLIPSVYPYRVPIALLFIAIIAFGNLRGVKESGRIFAVPTYAFVVAMFLMIGYGIYQATVGGGLEPRRPQPRADPRGRGHRRRRVHPPAPGLRLRWRRRHRRRGHLQRCARVQGAVLEERQPDARDHGRHARRHVPRASRGWPPSSRPSRCRARP